MSSHTPEPWKVVRPSGNGNCRRIFAGDEFVAIVGGSDQSMDTIIANADLIAAAPELLEELEWMLEKANEAGWSTDLLKPARAAIAKARGL